jgi:transposase
VIPLQLLPRRCPICRNETIVGHGRRLRLSHDGNHERIWVRRGICRPCGKTFTALPDWLAPSGHYSLHCRQQACDHLAAGDTAERAAPHCKDPARLPDPSTVIRWAQRRLISLYCWLKAGVKDRHFLQAPTILAWDLATLSRILPFEARSP